MYEREIDSSAIHWDSDQVAEYLQQRCLQNPPSPYETLLGDVWHDILKPFFADHRKHSPIKRHAVLSSKLAEVDAIWAQVGTLHFAISDACSAIAFVLSICLPSFPPDDWLSIAAVFVHFCRLAPRDSRPATIRILWQSQSNSSSPPDPSLSYPSPEHFLNRQKVGARAIILLDDVISRARATSIPPSSNFDPNSYDTYDATTDKSNSTHKVFRLQKPEELLDTLGLKDVWPYWGLPNSSPDSGILPEIPKSVSSDFESDHKTWPSSCRCSAIMPTIYVINEQKPVRGVAFAFKPFCSLLQQYRKGDVPHQALLEAVEPWCDSCRLVFRRIGVRFEDLASSSTSPKEPLACVSYTDVDVYRDLDLPKNEFEPPTRPSSQSTSPLHSLGYDLYPPPPSSPHALPLPTGMPPRSTPASRRVFPIQLPSDRDQATPPKAVEPLIQRSWVRSSAFTHSRGQMPDQQAQTQHLKGDARVNALKSHTRPSPTPPMPRMESESMGQRLEQPGKTSERRRSPLSKSPTQAPASYPPPRPSSTGTAESHNLMSADIRSASALGYVSPPVSPRSLNQQQAPTLPDPLYSLSRSSKPRMSQTRPTVTRTMTTHYPYAVAPQPTTSATFNNPTDPAKMHARTESTFRTTYQPADVSGANYYSQEGHRQQPLPTIASPNYHAAATLPYQQVSPSPYPTNYHQTQAHSHALPYPTPAGYSTSGRPSRSNTMPMPGSDSHFSPQSRRAHYYGQQQLKTPHHGEWDDYEFVSPPPLTQQQQNYYSVPASSRMPQFQQQSPRSRQQQKAYPSPPYTYSHTKATTQGREYNYNADDGTYDHIVPVYPR